MKPCREDWRPPLRAPFPPFLFPRPACSLPVPALSLLRIQVSLWFDGAVACDVLFVLMAALASVAAVRGFTCWDVSGDRNAPQLFPVPW